MLSAVLVAGLAVAAAASPVIPSLHSLYSRQDVQSPYNASLPNITIFATGGTIASLASSNTETVVETVGLGVQELVAAVPEILNYSNIQGYQVSNVPSSTLNQTVLLKLAPLVIKELAKDNVTGVVITHGSDTLEETAYFLSLVVNSTKPVVVVGAMRPATALSADGPLNLLQAVSLASSPSARGRGVMITLNDRIGSATYTSKYNANALDTFHSTEPGQLGFFINQLPYFYYQPALPIRRKIFDISGTDLLPQIDIIISHQDMDAKLFNSTVQNGAKGIVVAGTGAGGVTRPGLAVAEAVFNATGTPIVASHRTPDGFVPFDPDNAFLIPSGFLNPWKARILLQLAVNAGYDYDEIVELFGLGQPAS
ncbi:hypothetical protein AYO20_00360 [Fonsecaea nubica]|uniref:asparaginase n=1 Tax=Fonsecaea nubica TaxID=856822 RepID=A0A178DH34_9EURO|nr:hypothetical protein AYO20_00360 [Fonsecaea nubica]OAL40624.1 hypothetical protein AYO20_00360 [Fonsecaea nubica]